MMIDKEIIQTINDQVDQLQGELIELASALIQIPSTNPCLDSVEYEEVIGGEKR